MSMNIRIELLDTLQQRIAIFNEAIALEAIRCVPDQLDTLECVLPHVRQLRSGMYHKAVCEQ